MSSAVDASANDAKARAKAPQAWHFLSHLRRLFAGRPAPRPGSEAWASLDGWRGLLCLWMVAFHSFFYAGNFIQDAAMQAVGLSPALLILNLGFLPVDGFFVLTGFLIAYPLFKEEARRLKKLREEEQDRATRPIGHEATAAAAAAVANPWSFDLSTFYYRRVTRMLPSYILAVYFHCGVLFPGGVQHSLDVIRSEGFRGLLARVLPDITAAPNHCTPGYLFTNFTWTNHLMPFGGCMGWTWSFALQFNFYLFFPLLWKWAHARLARQTPSSNRAPSAFVLPFLYAFIAIGLLVRVGGFLQIRTFDLRHEEALFLGFFWYSNTWCRGAAIAWGVLAAYASVHTGMVAYLRQRSGLVTLGWLLSFGTIFAQMFWSRIWAEGVMVETPGWSTLELTQKLGGEGSLNFASPNIGAYWWHALFHIGVLVGSPLSNLLWTFLLVVLVNGLGSLGRSVQRLLSHPAWYPVSTLSWWVYLVHPALMTRFYVWHTENVGDLEATVGAVYSNVALQWALSFSVALVAYCLIEQPLEILLRQGEAAPAPAVTGEKAAPRASAASTFLARLRSLIFVYCCFCMVCIVLHHFAMHSAVLSLVPKPYVPAPSA